MKRIALAAALMTAFAGSAMAQSSVSLYGRINTSVEYRDTGISNTTVMANNASRWGLKGSEDLGGGLNAFFQLESGFNSDNGAQSQPGRSFGREAFIGMKGSFGQLKAGRITSALYYATIDYIGNFNHNTGVTSEDNFYTLNFTSDNAVEYTSPSFGGFVVALTTNARENTVPQTNEAVLSYDQGALHLGGGYSETKSSSGANVVKGYSLAGSYTMGAFTAGVAYNSGDYTTLGRRNHVQVTGMYAFGANELHLSYGMSDSYSNVADTGASQLVVGYNYNLSKRTKVYAFWMGDKNDQYATLAPVAAADHKGSIFGAGVRHNF
jgi:predicted porin